jgi:hypothetical protein
VGLLDYEAELPVKSKRLGRTVAGTAHIANAPNAGLEAGLEGSYDDFLCRAWTSIDSSINTGKTASIRSEKAGLDSLWSMGTFNGLGLSLVAFTFGERLDIDFDKEKSEVGSVRYLQAFLGAGMSVTW